VVGNPIEFRIWQESSALELDGTPTFVQGGHFGDPVTVVNPLTSTTSGIGDDGTVTGPASFLLSQNYPNPFNPSTAIRFTLSSVERVSLEVYDLHGTRVTVLLDGRLPAGEHEIFWDGTDSRHARVSSGTYIVRMKAGGTVQEIKLLMLK
jgi:flagellar hook assembly protein FlgD